MTFQSFQVKLDLSPARSLLAQYKLVFLESRTGLSGAGTFIAGSQS